MQTFHESYKCKSLFNVILLDVGNAFSEILFKMRSQQGITGCKSEKRGRYSNRPPLTEWQNKTQVKEAQGKNCKEAKEQYRPPEG